MINLMVNGKARETLEGPAPAPASPVGGLWSESDDRRPNDRPTALQGAIRQTDRSLSSTGTPR